MLAIKLAQDISLPRVCRGVMLYQYWAHVHPPGRTILTDKWDHSN